MKHPFRFACPTCHYPVRWVGDDFCYCPDCKTQYPRENGIWKFLMPEVKARYEQFMQEYHTVRQKEGRGSSEPDYYRRLPYEDLTGKFTADWKIRARSFRALVRSVILPLERRLNRSLKILDLGAGNGWLSYRLAQRGHQLAAVDLQIDPLDGLGAHPHYDQPFLPVQADMNHLPFCDQQVDAAIYNASFHYSTGYETSLREALRVLSPEGTLVILDTPIYRDASSGYLMVEERERRFLGSYGFVSNAIQSENFLTHARLEELGEETGLQWDLVRVNYGLAWAMRPIKAGLVGRREPAQFRIVAGRRL